MPTWSQIASDPDYLSLPDTEKRKVADGFYNKTIGADADFQSLPDEEKQKVRFGFYTKSGFAPQEQPSKNTFNLGRGVAEFTRPLEIPGVSKPVQTMADFVSRVTKAGEEKLGKLGAGSPTLEPITTAGQGVLTGIRGVAQLGAQFAKPSAADVLTGFAASRANVASKEAQALAKQLQILRSAPAEVKTAEIAKLVKEKGQKAVEEAISIAELEAKTGTPEKARAALTFVTPSRLQTETRMTRPFRSAPAPSTTGKPFTMQAGLGEQNRAALEAFRAKLPQGPATAPRMVQEAVSAPKPAIPTVPAPAAPIIKAGEGFAGNINLSKYPKPIADLIKVGNKQIGFAERASQTIPELKATGGTPEAQALYKQIVSAPEGSVPGAIANAREVFNKEAEVVIGKLDNILSAGTDDIDSLVALSKKGQEVSRSAQMAGQSLRVFKEAADSKLAQQLVDKVEEIKLKALATNSPLVKPYIEGLTALQKQISKKAFDISQTSKVYRKVMETSDKAYYVFLNSILSNPVTHARNIAGNTVFIGMKPIEKMAAAAIDNSLSMFTGRPATHTFGEVGAQLKAAGKYIVGKGEKLPFDITKAGQKLDAEIASPISGKIGDIIGLPIRALKIEDDLAKNLIGQMEYAGLRSKGLTGEALKSGVNKEAAYRTFQEESGPIVKLLTKARDVIPGAKWVIPFVKTPSQLFLRGIERSPLGFGKVIAKGMKGGYSQADFSADLGNALLGSSAAAFLSWQYGKGKITGSYPADKDERERWQAEGKLPYSVKIKGRWMPLDRIEPIGSIVKVAIAGVDAYKTSNQEMPEEKASEIAIRLGKELTSQSALNGFNNLSQSLSDPERYAGKTIAGIATGFVPGASKFAADLSDPYLRAKKGVVETAKSKIPGLSRTLPPQRDILGAPIKKDAIFGSEAKATPELDFAKELGVNLPDTKKMYQPTTPLTTFEANQYRALVGEDMRRLLQYEMRTPSFSDLEKERKHIESQISRIVDKKKGIINTKAEFRNLGISFNPNPTQAEDIYKTVMRDKDYKAASKEQRRAMLNKFILYRQSGGR